MGQGVSIEKPCLLLFYEKCGDCGFSNWLDSNWISCGHPTPAKASPEDADLRDDDDYEGAADAPIPKTCPLRERRALLGIKEGF